MKKVYLLSDLQEGHIARSVDHNYIALIVTTQKHNQVILKINTSCYNLVHALDVHPTTKFYTTNSSTVAHVTVF